MPATEPGRDRAGHRHFYGEAVSPRVAVFDAGSHFESDVLHRAVYDVGSLLKVYGALPAGTVLVALAWGELYAVPAFAVTAALAYALGRGLEVLCSDPPPGQVAAGVLTVTVGWFLVGVLSAVPLYAVARSVAGGLPVVATPEPTPSLAVFGSPPNALFEGMSGVTGTGFSMANDPSVLPRAVQWWRSLLQWVGGIGVVVLAAAFAGSEDRASFRAIHGSKAPTESIRSSTRGTAAALWWLLALFTVAGALLLWLAGMGPWAALNHAMTGVTTGGFTVTGDSIAAYDDPVVVLATVPLMLAGAVSFALWYFLLRGDSGRVVGDVQTEWLLGGVALGTALVVAVLASAEVYPSTWASLRYGGYQLVSGLTTAGFQTETDLGSRWPAAGQLVVVGSMLVGGAVGSTVGGIKLLRVRRILQGLSGHGSSIYEPDEVSTETAGAASTEFDSAASIALLWVGALLATTTVATVVLPLDSTGYTTANVLFEVASVQGNVGLGAGIVGPGMPDALKVAFAVSMWAGRLEFIPLLVATKTLLREVGG